MGASALQGTIYTEQLHEWSQKASNWLLVSIALFGMCVGFAITAVKIRRKSVS